MTRGAIRIALLLAALALGLYVVGAWNVLDAEEAVRSSAVERVLYKGLVAGSIPAAPTAPSAPYVLNHAELTSMVIGCMNGGAITWTDPHTGMTMAAMCEVVELRKP